MHTDNGIGDDAVVPFIGAIDTDSSLDPSDVLATIGGSGSVAIGGGGSVVIGGARAVGNDGDILHAGNSVISAAGGGILGTRRGSGPNHVAIHNFPAPRAFMTVAPPLCAHKESHWSFTLLPGRRSTSDLTHHQRSKMLLSE
jgi:hypothetical protein